MELTQQVNMTGIMDSISKAVEKNSLYLKKKKRTFNYFTNLPTKLASIIVLLKIWDREIGVIWNMLNAYFY